MVGTTERETSDLPVDPVPSEDEVTEVLERIKRDLPRSGLTRDTLVYAFAGIRTLPIRAGGKKRVSQYSRKHIWSFSRGVLSLVGGKYTTFAWTAREGLALALKQLGCSTIKIPHAIDDLPGNTSAEEHQRLVATISSHTKAPHDAITRAVSRLGKQCERYLANDRAWKEIAPGILRVELLHAVMGEQSVCVEDIMRRRLEVEYLEGHGLAALPDLVDYLKQLDPTCSAELEAQEYACRMSQIEQLLHNRSGPIKI
jgi:glycerol-3-phosphate dehydrogenase